MRTPPNTIIEYVSNYYAGINPYYVVDVELSTSFKVFEVEITFNFQIWFVMIYIYIYIGDLEIGNVPSPKKCSKQQ